MINLEGNIVRFEDFSAVKVLREDHMYDVSFYKKEIYLTKQVMLSEEIPIYLKKLSKLKELIKAYCSLDKNVTLESVTESDGSGGLLEIDLGGNADYPSAETTKVAAMAFNNLELLFSFLFNFLSTMDEDTLDCGILPTNSTVV